MLTNDGKRRELFRPRVSNSTNQIAQALFQASRLSHSCMEDGSVSRVNGLGYVGSIFLSVAGRVGLPCLCVDGANKFVILSRCSA
jgi:hypothetical protein